jgi:hypothetical protein
VEMVRGGNDQTHTGYLTSATGGMPAARSECLSHVQGEHIWTPGHRRRTPDALIGHLIDLHDQCLYASAANLSNALPYLLGRLRSFQLPQKLGVRSILLIVIDADP